MIKNIDKELEKLVNVVSRGGGEYGVGKKLNLKSKFKNRYDHSEENPDIEKAEKEAFLILRQNTKLGNDNEKQYLQKLKEDQNKSYHNQQKVFQAKQRRLGRKIGGSGAELLHSLLASQNIANEKTAAKFKLRNAREKNLVDFAENNYQKNLIAKREQARLDEASANLENDARIFNLKREHEIMDKNAETTERQKKLNEILLKDYHTARSSLLKQLRRQGQFGGDYYPSDAEYIDYVLNRRNS